MEAYKEENQDHEADALNVIQKLTDSLKIKRDEAVTFRASSGIEQKWREDDAAFDGDGAMAMLGDGKSMLDYATGEAYINTKKGPKRSEVVVNVIRGKTEIAEGRFSDILLPVNGKKSWGLKVTPVPEISKALKDDRLASKNGEPIDKDGKPTDKKNAIKMSDVAKSEMDLAKDRMKSMETEIDDQLVECSYDAELRKVIKKAARLGTGILKGPNVVKSVKKKYIKGDDGIFTLDVVEDFTPASFEVSCWNIFPDPDVEEDIRRASYIWERESITPRELSEFIGVPGYIDSQIILALKEKPERLSAEYDDKEKKHYTRYKTVDTGNLYEKWEYYGDISRDDLEAMGVDLEDQSEYLNTFSGCVVMVNSRPIKVCLNTLDTGELPYDFFQWTEVSGSPWGVGLPRIMMWLQRIITAAWRAMMDNAGDSSGANVVISNKIEPVDGIYELTGKKIWQFLEDDIDNDVKKAFVQFQVENNQSDLQNIIELALKFLDMETAIPMIFQGEQQKIPETLGATNIMVDSNNVSLRSRAKLFDDRVSEPHIKRYYHWNMQYNDKEEIKGDYGVDAVGSILAQKDQQANTLQQVMALKADKDVSLLVDWEKAIKQLFSFLGLDILKSEEEYKKAKVKMAEQPPPQDPRVETAKIKRETDLEKAKLDQQSDIEEIQTKGAITEKDLQFKAEQAELERQHDLQMKSMDRDIKMMEFAEKRNMSLDQIKGKLSSDAMKLKTQVSLAGPDKKGPQVVKPIVEPEGRAPDGEAFQK